MLKSLALTAALFFGLHANANLPNIIDLVRIQPIDGLQFNIGDSTDYNLSGFVSGTMHTQVREEVTEGFWVQTDLDAGFMGRQKIEVLYDRDNGQVLKLLVNGQEQEKPDPSQMKIVESKKDHIKVPKGEFDCFYVKVRDTQQNKDSEIWLAKEVPIGGMIKTVNQSPFGPMTLELTDYHKN